MNDSNGLTFIPDRVRQVIYLTLTVLSLLFYAGGEFLKGSPWGEPWWIESGMKALGVLLAPFGVLAAANIKRDQPVEYADAQYAVQGEDGNDLILN